jgi:hypothetical protein
MSRTQIIEKDLSGFINTLVDETGAMVLTTAKGKSTPMYLQSEEDCLRELGRPSATYHGVFEAIAFTRRAPLYVACAIGTGAVYGGVDVGAATVTTFGVGRTPSTFNYGSTLKGATHSVGIGTGITATYSGIITNIPVADEANFKVLVNGYEKVVTMATGGALSGTDITAGSVVLATGVYSITFAGVVGSYATVITNVNFSSTLDLSLGSTDKYIKISIDGNIQTINLGQSATTSRASVISAINSAFGYTAAVVDTNYIRLTGRNGSTIGSITVETPTTGDSALTIVFSSGGTSLTDIGSNPTLSIPKYGEAVIFNYHYTVDTSSVVSHSFFTTSPYIDDLAASITYVSGSKFTLTLYRVLSTGNSLLNTYNYSLINEKDAFGKSLYYIDVFDENPYVTFKLNSAFVSTPYTVASTAIAFSGGSRGATPLTGDYTTAWNQFQYANKYKAKIFMDVYGTHASTINTLIQTYQTQAQGITCVPLGYSASQALSFRSALALDTDDIGLYHNWAKIQDDYNNSFAWISHVGSVGKKFAYMSDVYDAAAPAGLDENGHGGQLNDWSVKEVEIDYTQAELDSFYNAQINPLLLDPSYGLLAYGDQTLQVTNSDTSFVGTRRVYKYMLDVISKQILRKQEFKINDPLHRLMAKVQTEEFVEPIRANGWIREFKIVCDSSNNTDIVLNNRQFILDFYCKITPTSEWIILRLTRVSQTISIESLII